MVGRNVAVVERRINEALPALKHFVVRPIVAVRLEFVHRLVVGAERAALIGTFGRR